MRRCAKKWFLVINTNTVNHTNEKQAFFIYKIKILYMIHQITFKICFVYLFVGPHVKVDPALTYRYRLRPAKQTIAYFTNAHYMCRGETYVNKLLEQNG